jgi:hypothetical protein
MGSIIKFQLQKTIARPPPEIPKKRKKSVGTLMGPFVSDKYRVRQNYLSRWVRPGCERGCRGLGVTPMKMSIVYYL